MYTFKASTQKCILLVIRDAHVLAKLLMGINYYYVLRRERNNFNPPVAFLKPKNEGIAEFIRLLASELLKARPEQSMKIDHRQSIDQSISIGVSIWVKILITDAENFLKVDWLERAAFI